MSVIAIYRIVAEMLLSEQKSKNNNNTKKQSRKVKEILASLSVQDHPFMHRCIIFSAVAIFRSFQEVSLHLMCAGEDKKQTHKYTKSVLWT